MCDSVQCEEHSVLSTDKMDGQGQARRRWERCRTPMGTVPLSVIHGFDYPVCDYTSGYCFYNLICIFAVCFIAFMLYKDVQQQEYQEEPQGAKQPNLSMEFFGHHL